MIEKLNKKNMKTKILSLLCLFSTITLYAQEGSVGIGTKAPDKSAILDLSSSNKGILIPRMTSEERIKISNPAIGLKVYQTDGLLGEYSFDGRKWNRILQEGDAKSVALDAANWSKTGDAGTNLATNFLGTTDNVGLAFRVNNQKAGLIDHVNRNLFLGPLAGNVIGSGTDNVGLGGNALLSNTTGSANLAVGSSALRMNTAGIWNFAVGIAALQNNTTGEYNTALGPRALFQNSTGIVNFAIGSDALYNNTSSYNFAIGPNALFLNTTGSSNFAVGRDALRSNTTGNNNVGFGTGAGYLNSTGSGNVFIGLEAGYNETSSNKLYIANSNTTMPLIYGDFNAKYVSIGDVSSAQRNQAKLTGEYNLLVKGGILTEKVKVALASTADWADYVFAEDYKLSPLDKVEAHLKEKKHLPNFPSAEDMVKDGLDVTKTTAKLLEKIEELTLYVIELNKKINALEKK